MGNPLPVQPLSGQTGWRKGRWHHRLMDPSGMWQGLRFLISQASWAVDATAIPEPPRDHRGGGHPAVPQSDPSPVRGLLTRTMPTPEIFSGGSTAMDESGTSSSDERPAGQDSTPARPAPYWTGPAGQDRGVRRRGGPGAGRGFRPHQAYPSAPAPRPRSPRPFPRPARSSSVPTEDDNETGQDSQTNIFVSTVPGLVHVISAREGRRHRPGAHAVGQGADHPPAVRRSRSAQREVRAVRQDVQGHRPRHGPLRGPGAAPDAGRLRPVLLHRGGRELYTLAASTYASSKLGTTSPARSSIPPSVPPVRKTR